MGKVTKPARRSRPPETPQFELPEDADMFVAPRMAPESPAKMRVNQLLRQHDSNSEILARVYMVRGNDEYFQYIIPDPTPESILEDRLRDANKGRGGKFRVRIFVDGDESGTIDYLIDDAPGLNPEVIPAGAQLPAAIDPGLKLVLDQLARLTEKIAAPAPQGNMVEMINALKGLNELQGGANKGLQVSDMIQLINLGKDIGSGSAPDSDGWMGILKGVVKEAAPVIMPAIMAAAQQSNNPPAQRPALPAQQQQGESMAMQESALLKTAIVFLKKKAENPGSNPNIYIGLILENEEEEPYAGLIYRINTEEFSFFEKFDADLSREPYRAYFRAIYDGVRFAYSSTDSVDNNPAGTGGNAGNSGSDGAAGKGGAA